MIIYDVLRHEHYVIRAYLKRILDLGERRPATRLRQFAQLQSLLAAHAAATDAIFHEPLMAHASTAALARQGRIRQDVAASLVEVIAGLEPADPEWPDYFVVLAEALELHMRQQEKELFRKARKVLDRETEEQMGEALLQVGKGREAMVAAEIPPVVAGEGGRSLH